MAPAIVSAPIRRQGSARQSAPPYAGLDCVRHYDLGVGYAVAVATASLINPWLQKHEIPDNSRLDYNQARPHSSLGTLTPQEFAELQGNGPPEQAQGSAARPLALPPHLGHNINPELYS